MDRPLSDAQGAPASPARLKGAYAYCARIARAHYENFPVASWLLPARLRGPVSAIYAFARTADDFADEKQRGTAERLALLDGFSLKIEAARRGDTAEDPIFIALADAAQRFDLPWVLLHDLLTAFRMDVTKRRYSSFDEVLAYCRYSANPIGRLLLHLYRAATPENLRDADAICSALQLINFMQDINQDYVESNRIYIPLDELAHFGLGEDDIAARRNSEAMHRLVMLQVERARRMLQSGSKLGRRLPWRAGLELRLILAGGEHVARLLAAQSDVFSRPRLRRRDRLAMFFRALRG